MADLLIDIPTSWRRSCCLGLMILVAAGCSTPPDAPEASPDPAASAAPAVAKPAPPESAKVILPDGFEITIELAITPDELAQGLMYRPKLADTRGMLLVFNEERLPNIWMMNTLVALDLVYLDHTGTVVDVVADAQPCQAEPCPRFTPKHPARAVLEITSGSAARHGVVDGVKLIFEHSPDFPPNG
jgi:uncharacterized membrane protein (UPF0127 family)